MHATQRRTKAARGFTIVEVLVVIMLIGLLAVFVVPQYLSKTEEAKRKVARSHIALLEERLGAFLLDNGRYPEQGEGLQALIKAPAGLTEKWKGPYCKPSQLLDPWGNPFEYRRPGQHNPEFDIICYGRDGQQGGENEDADIFNN